MSRDKSAKMSILEAMGFLAQGVINITEAIQQSCLAAKYMRQ